MNIDSNKHNINIFNAFTYLFTFGKPKQIIPTNEIDFLGCIISDEINNLDNDVKQKYKDKMQNFNIIITNDTTATLFFDVINKSNSGFLTGIIHIYIDNEIIYSNEIYVGKYISQIHGLYMALFDGLQKISSMNIYNIILKTTHYKVIKQIQNNSFENVNSQIKEYYIGVKRILRNMNDIKYDYI